MSAKTTTSKYCNRQRYIMSRFNKPIVVHADVGLFLATGRRGARADFYSGGNGSYDVTFM